MEKYYVTLVRLFKEKDIVNIFDYNEAIERNWIDKNGNRIWVVPTEDELSSTFVWEFDNFDDAINFAIVLSKNELGISTECA